MGFLDRIDRAAADQIAWREAKIIEEINTTLVPGEAVENLYILPVDYLVLTNKRLMFVDKKWNSTKKAVISVPWNKISAVLMERGGFMSFIQEIEVVVGSKAYEFKFQSAKDSMDAYKAIFSKVV